MSFVKTKKSNIIGIAADHAGYELKEIIKEHLCANGYEVKDFGTNSTESADYPDYIHPLAEYVEANENNRGIAICGSGNGVSITANKHQQVRAALCWTAELAKLAIEHNNANICSLPARFITTDEAINILNAFLTSQFEGGRHQRRVEKIPVR